jgi:tripartite-type tricarboxylate transporter receptor subunit TctC
MKRGFAVVLGALTLAQSLSAAAQAYPSKLVRIVVTLPPGGSIDLTARVVAEKLQTALGRPVVVDNRPGASGNIAADIVAKSAPDGHTLLVTSTGHVVNPAFHAKLPFDPIADFAPVALMTSVHFALAVHPSVPATGVREFLAIARARPGALTFASAGHGASQHLAMELLKSMARVDLAHVPYKGAGQFVPALLTGEVASVIGAINSLLPHVQTRKLRLLALAGNRRTPLLPDVPTIAEVALPGYAIDNWCGMLAPSGTPRPVIDRLNADIVKALRDPQMKERFNPQGIEVIPSTPDEFQAVMKADMVKWAKVVKDAKIKVE